jgi:hypothetical protein
MLILFLFLIPAAVGCGSGDSTSDSSSLAVQPLRPEGPSNEFYVPGGDNAVQLYGREASAAERAQASRVIGDWMRAREDKDHALECTYMSRSFIKGFVKDAANVSKGKVTTCPATLAFFGFDAGGVNFLTNTTSGPIDSLRIESGQGYAQYHGNDGHDYIVAVDKEDGRWLVATSAPFDRADAE